MLLPVHPRRLSVSLRSSRDATVFLLLKLLNLKLEANSLILPVVISATGLGPLIIQFLSQLHNLLILFVDLSPKPL